MDYRNLHPSITESCSSKAYTGCDYQYGATDKQAVPSAAEPAKTIKLLKKLALPRKQQYLQLKKKNHLNFNCFID
jgi:hypothetical protein